MATQIVTNQIAADAITAAKIADNAVGSDALDQSVDFAFTGDITSTATITGDNQVATKSYVDQLVGAGIYWKEPVLAASDEALTGAYTGAALTITFDGNGAMETVDGVTPVLNSRLLIKDESAGNAKYNGIYYVSTQGDGSNPTVLTRVTDMNAGDEFKGASVNVLSGTANDNTQWTCSNDSDPTVGTTAISFVQLSKNPAVAAGNGITVTGSTVTVKPKTSGSGLTVDTDGVYIADGGVVADMLGSGSVTSAKLGTGAVGTTAIADDAVDGDKITGDAINGTHIEDSAVNTDQLADSAVTTDKISWQWRAGSMSTDGSTTTEDLDVLIPTEFIEGLFVFRNGLMLTMVESSPSDVDEYTVSSTGGGSPVSRITFGAAPSASDVVVYKYLG